MIYSEFKGKLQSRQWAKLVIIMRYEQILVKRTALTMVHCLKDKSMGWTEIVKAIFFIHDLRWLMAWSDQQWCRTDANIKAVKELKKKIILILN